MLLQPQDKYNQILIDRVHPPQWINPEPAPIYNLIVIGGGTAGLVTAAGAAGLGAKVALIEKNLLGGDCLNAGCVPSKSIIRSARFVAEICQGEKLGINLEKYTVNFGKVMERMRQIRANISSHDSAQRFQGLGVDVFFGSGKFFDKNTIEVNAKKLSFKNAVIATGTRAFIPSIAGLETAGYLTNETVFSLTEKHHILGVIGAGPIGCELAQTFSLLGCEVILFHKNSHILDREDTDAAEIIQQTFISQGIKLVLESNIKQVEVNNNGEFPPNIHKTIYYEIGGKLEKVTVDEILVATGRSPNVENLNLDTVGVKYDNKKGIIINDYLQTNNPRIYAAGDICMDKKFTHAADAAARIVIQNSLFLGRKKLSDVTIPWCTYTYPEIAHVGINETTAKAQGIEINTFAIPMTQVDRAITDGETDGFVKIHVKKGTDKILGATIVASHAGDMISEITLAMVGNIGLSKLANVIHPYPTQAEAIKKVADAYNRTRLTPLIKDLFNNWLAWRR